MKYSSSSFIFDQDQNSKRAMINGPRPSPLKISKDSHHHWTKPRRPVVIYTRSPETIHTQAGDFMSLVQRLTGLSRDDHSRQIKAAEKQRSNPSSSDNESSDEIERHGHGNGGNRKLGFGQLSPDPCFADIPWFATPTGTDLNFFWSPAPEVAESNGGSSWLSPNIDNLV